MSGVWSNVSVINADPNRRAREAEIGSSKKIHAWAPLPERDRSMATGTSQAWQAWAKAFTSRRHSASSKSAAKNQQVSSGRTG